MKNRKFLFLAVALLFFAAVGFKLASNKKIVEQRTADAIEAQQFDLIPVKTATVQPREIGNALTQSGTFTAEQELKLTAQSQGQITRLLVKKMQTVRKGTVLAVIDNSSLSTQLTTAEAALEKAQTDVQRLENALASGGVSQQQVEEARLRVQNAHAQIAQLKQQGRNYQVVAPMAGVVNDIFIEEGSFVAVGNPILEIVDLTRVLLTVRLDPKNLPDIRIGQKVNVTSDVYPQTVFAGKVEDYNVKTDLSQKVEVGVSVQNASDKPLLVGMYGRAEFVPETKKVAETALVLPRAAITGSIQDAQVWVVNPADSTVVSKHITIGRSFDNQVEILNGLKQGEEVVTAGQINLEAGKKIVVKN